MSIAERCAELSANNAIIAENQPKIYEAGQKSITDAIPTITTTVGTNKRYLRIDDISEVPHSVTIFNPMYSDATYVYGKNLFNPQLLLDNGYTQLEDGTYQGKTARQFCIYSANNAANGIFTISYTAKNIAARTENALCFLIKYTDGTQEYKAGLDRTITQYTYVSATTDVNKIVAEIYMSYVSRNEINIKEIQLEWGGAATAYEPYKRQYVETPWIEEKQMHIGVAKSFYPTMTISGYYDDHGVHATYNKSYGKQAAYDEFWDAYQVNGTRGNYAYAFSNSSWRDVIFKPKYDIAPNGSADHIFYTANISTDGFQDAINKGIIFDFSKATNLAYGFSAMQKTTEIPFDVSLIGASSLLTGLFGWNSYLKTIKKIIVREDGSTPLSTTMFEQCLALENVTFEGEIGKNINFSYSPKLTHTSLMSIINHLKDYNGSGTTYTLTLGATNLAKLTDTEKAKATQKGWTLA